MPFHSKEYAKKYVSENNAKIHAIQLKYFYAHREEESIRCRKKYAYNKECKRLRMILQD